MSAVTVSAPWGECSVDLPRIPGRQHRARLSEGTECTNALQQSIDELAAQGGGRLVIPAGVWTCGPLFLRSAIELHLEAGAVLSFSSDFHTCLPGVFARWGGIECINYKPMLYALDATDIRLSGSGTIAGNGEPWWNWVGALQKKSSAYLYDLVLRNVVPSERRMDSPEHHLRPSLLQFVRCKRVAIETVTVHSGPMWTIHPVYCSHVYIRGITVRTTGHNNDGLVPDSCRDVVIEDCLFATGDDCIVIKSGLDEDGLRVGKASENIVVRRCRTEGGHGGIVVGSELSGSVRRIHVHDCVFHNTQKAFRIKSTRGRGGTVEDIWVEDIDIKGTRFEAIEINAFYRGSHFKSSANAPTIIRNIHLRKITCRDAHSPIQIMGLPEYPVESVFLEDIDMGASDGFWCSNVDMLSMKRCRIVPEGGQSRIVRSDNT